MDTVVDPQRDERGKHDWVILSQEVEPSDQYEHEYRIEIGRQVKYITIEPGTYEQDVLDFPCPHELPKLPPGDWTCARIFRQPGKAQPTIEFSSRKLLGLSATWHPDCIEILSLTLKDRLSFRVRVAQYGSKLAVAKIARFEWELQYVEQETAVYKTIDGLGIAPQFLGHLAEEGRVMGLLLEKVEGRLAGIEDLDACRSALKRLHALGILHGDTNRHNYIVTDQGVKVIDFENAIVGGSQEQMDEECAQLALQLTETSGRGGGYIWTEEAYKALQD
ncbi:hypothetical protein GLOTRDRAFT_126310 [Gloeophyllum trabeum ATCC 11539]|uniref:Alpha-galactosidase A n=1 Tax=Gloeophyllum trabeum (strain ATCC 11539 / FP-39264 / Madison 617) TaxID=670483 RepID=S7RWT7_GLOTA|nr:uncharacterized protein GLOTRDRAFT_126310 [Gloeophyllum trabeum ATCC 11539]EPQ57819.1 hypothetical protein GLOTRDRAFT_126310 [Gloeophyllum trabeum ATCC 11539]